jgi:hypothetical protein
VLEPVTALGIAVLLAGLSPTALVIPSTYLHTQLNEVSSTVERWRRGNQQPERPPRPFLPRMPLPGETPVPRSPQTALSSPTVIQASEQASDLAAAHLLLSVAALVVYNLTEWRSWHPRTARARRRRREKAEDFTFH